MTPTETITILRRYNEKIPVAVMPEGPLVIPCLPDELP